MVSSKLLKLSLLLLSFCLLFSCGEKSSSKQSPADKNVVAQQPKTDSSALIYWDISIPVKGYFSTDKGLKSVLHNDNLLVILMRNGFKEPYYIITVGNDVSDTPEKIESNGMQKFRELSTYSNTETSLHKIFNDMSAIYKFPLIIVATDGLQSSKKVIAGIDPTPVVSGIKKILDTVKGINFWIISVKAPFYGKRYSEFLHLDTTENISERCPFYFWIFSREEEKGSKVVQELCDLLIKNKISDSSNVKKLKLYPLVVPDFLVALKVKEVEPKDIVLASTAKGDKLGKEREQKLWCKRDGKVEYPINELIDLGDLGIWQLTYDLVTNTKEGLFRLDGSNLSIDCSLAGKSNMLRYFSKAYEKDYQAKIKVKGIELKPISGSNIWWRQWSTEDDWAEPTKTYKLAQFMEDIIKHSLMKNPPELTIKVLKE